MSSYDLGDGVPLRYEARTPDGTLVDATVVLTLTAPDGTTSTPPLTRTATGIYDAVVVVGDQVGTWFYDWAVSGPVTDHAHGQFDVADPAPPVYATLDELKQMRNAVTAEDDTALMVRLVTASRAIDERCGYPARRFWLDTAATARVFSPRGRTITEPDGELLLIDDIGSLDDLAVEIGYGSSWTPVSDYETGPDNAPATRKAVTELLRPGGRWRGVAGPRTRIRVSARWGWPVVPDGIHEATLLLANRLYLRKTSPDGVAASGEWGAVRVSKWDPDVESLVQPYELFGVGR